MRKWEDREEREVQKDEKEGGGEVRRVAHSIDSRAIRAIVRESAGRGGAGHH